MNDNPSLVPIGLVFGGIFFAFLALTTQIMFLPKDEIRSFIISWNQSESSEYIQIHKALFHATMIGLILMYVYLCENAPIFPHSAKFVSNDVLLFMLVLAAVAGFSSSRVVKNVELHREVMNKAQTNEWKGWMILFVIVASYFDGMQNAIQSCNGLFLWMSGYVSAKYSRESQNIGFSRLLRRLWRLNLICLLMRLTVSEGVSQETCLTHSLIAACAHSLFSRNQKRTSGKIVLLFLLGLGSILTLLVSIIDERECIWTFKNLSLLHSQAACMLLRKSYLAPLFGVAFACYSESVTNALPWSGTLFLEHLHIGILGFLWLTVLSLVQAGEYFIFIPAGIYVFFRNASKGLRSHVSQCFETIGKFSLELYLLSPHLLLSSSGAQRFVILRGSPLLNFAFTGMILFLASWQAFVSTSYLGDLIFHKATGSVHFSSRSLAMFLIFLLGLCSFLSLRIVPQVFLLLTILVVGLSLLVVAGRAADSRSPSRGRVSAAIVAFLLVGASGWIIHEHDKAHSQKTGSLHISCRHFVNNGKWMATNACSSASAIEAFNVHNVSSLGTCPPSSVSYVWGWEDNLKGCYFSYRHKSDLLEALKDRKILFAGDSIVRHLYHSMCRQFGDYTAGAYNTSAGKWTNYSRSYHDVRLDFIWSPFASQLEQLFTMPGNAIGVFDLVVIGGGPWDRLHRYNNESEVLSLQTSVGNIARGMRKLREKGLIVVWSVPTTINGWALTSDAKRENIREDQMAELRLEYKKLGVEDAANFVLDGPAYTADRVNESYDGVHYPLTVYDAGTQILANSFDWLLPRSARGMHTAIDVDNKGDHIDSKVHILASLMSLACLVIVLIRQDSFLFLRSISAGSPEVYSKVSSVESNDENSVI